MHSYIHQHIHSYAHSYMQGGFVAGVIDGDIRRILKSQNPPAVPATKGVVVAVGSTVTNIVEEADKDVLLLVYSPQDATCKKLRATYEMLAKAVQSEPKFVIAKIDGILMHKYSYVHTYIYTYMHAYIHIYMRTHALRYEYSYIHVLMHSHTHIFMHTYVHTLMHTYIHTYIHMPRYKQ